MIPNLIFRPNLLLSNTKITPNLKAVQSKIPTPQSQSVSIDDPRTHCMLPPPVSEDLPVSQYLINLHHRAPYK